MQFSLHRIKSGVYSLIAKDTYSVRSPFRVLNSNVDTVFQSTRASYKYLQGYTRKRQATAITLNKEHFLMNRKASLQFTRPVFLGERHQDHSFYRFCIGPEGGHSHLEVPSLSSWLDAAPGWGSLVLELKALLTVSVNGHTAMVGHGPGHGSHTCDDTCCRVVTENSVCGLSIFPSSTQDIYFTICTQTYHSFPV